MAAEVFDKGGVEVRSLTLATVFEWTSGHSLFMSTRFASPSMSQAQWRSDVGLGPTPILYARKRTV